MAKEDPTTVEFSLVPERVLKETVHPSEHVANAVKFLVASGMPKAHVAQALKMGTQTLDTYYSEEFESGKAQVDAYVTGKLFEHIVAGDKSSVQYYLNKKGGWNDKVDIGVSGFEISVSQKREIEPVGDEED